MTLYNVVTFYFMVKSITEVVSKNSSKITLLHGLMNIIIFLMIFFFSVWNIITFWSRSSLLSERFIILVFFYRCHNNVLSDGRSISTLTSSVLRSWWILHKVLTVFLPQKPWNVPITRMKSVYYLGLMMTYHADYLNIF